MFWTTERKEGKQEGDLSSGAALVSKPRHSVYGYDSLNP